MKQKYADDTRIIVKERYTTELKFKTNILIFRIKQWSSENKLSINKDKIKALIISQKFNETVRILFYLLTIFQYK